MNSISWVSVAEQHITKYKQPLPYQVIGLFFSLMSKVSLRKASEWFGQLWFAPVKGKISEKDQQWLTSARTTQLKFKGKYVPVYQWGYGPTIWCIHGWAGHSGQFRQIAGELIKSGYSVLCIDAPAHGKAQGKRTNLVAMSKLVLTLEQEFGAPYGIVAHSAGGLAVNYALQSGLKAEKTVFISTPLSLDYVIDISQHQMSLPLSLMDVHRSLIEKRFEKQVWDLLSMEKFQDTQPSLFLYDNSDNQVSPEMGLHLQRLHNKSQFSFSENLGHNRILRDENTRDNIVRFIAADPFTIEEKKGSPL